MFFSFFGIYFIILGVITIIKKIINIKKLSKIKNIVVDAIIIDYEKKEYSDTSNNFHLYIPIYEYYYNNIKYISKGTYGSNFKNKLNEKVKIMINFDNPSEIVEGKKSNNIISICYGIIFIIVGIFIVLLQCFEIK